MKPAVIILFVLMLLVSACAGITSFDSNISATDKASLAKIIASRDVENSARDGDRRPLETLAFLGVKSDMAIAEVLPGGGWYTEILAPYVAANGSIMGLAYSDEIWPMFGFFDAEQIAAAIERGKTFPSKAEGFVDGPIKARATSFGNIAKEDYGTLDAVLFIRALHNLHRFEEKGGTLTQAMSDTKNLLKPGGFVGVVQHWAPEIAPDEWADGNAGYIKESRIVEVFENAGFRLADRSTLNANANDKPTTDDVVWRLPPSLNTGKLEGVEKQAMIDKNTAIGESSRIILKFVKR